MGHKEITLNTIVVEKFVPDPTYGTMLQRLSEVALLQPCPRVELVPYRLRSVPRFPEQGGLAFQLSRVAHFTWIRRYQG